MTSMAGDSLHVTLFGRKLYPYVQVNSRAYVVYVLGDPGIFAHDNGAWFEKGALPRHPGPGSRRVDLCARGCGIVQGETVT
jgi:hypothetical protein